MNAPVLKIDALPDSPYNRRMVLGHAMRKNHAPDFRHVPADNILWHRVALCCGETIPETVDTWEAVTS